MCQATKSPWVEMLRCKDFKRFLEAQALTGSLSPAIQQGLAFPCLVELEMILWLEERGLIASTAAPATIISVEARATTPLMAVAEPTPW